MCQDEGSKSRHLIRKGEVEGGGEPISPAYNSSAKEGGEKS